MRKLMPFKKFITWTNEPRFDKTFEHFEDANCRIMNVYSGDVFFHNLNFLGSYHNNFAVDLGIDLKAPPGVPVTTDDFNRKNKFCICVFGYRDPASAALFYDGKNIDLFAKRQQLAIYLHDCGKTDIVGNNWPGDYTILEASGYENKETEWWTRKIALMKEYRYNICFENTAFAFYCTEKLWHAIAAGCLPVYFGLGTAVYETFPRNSFIEASEFSTNDDLLHFMENMSAEEYVNRYNVCLQVMHRSCFDRLSMPAYNTEIIDRFIDSVQILAGAK